jgi:iron complex transport system ATP-binding protein
LNITAQAITFSYQSTPTLNDVSLELQDSEVLGLIGPNGSGKTTLLKCLNKILQPKQGKIILDKKEISKMSRLEVAKQIAYVPQSSTDNPEDLRVYEIVLMGRRPHLAWQSSKEDNEKVWNALKTMEIEHLSMRSFFELSGGEQQRVLFARSLAQEAKVLLLDEPTSSLDIKHQLGVMELTRRLVATQKLSAVVAIHDLNLAARYCDRIIMMREGKVYAADNPKTVLTADNIRQVYGVEVEISYNKNSPYIIPITPLN